MSDPTTEDRERARRLASGYCASGYASMAERKILAALADARAGERALHELTTAKYAAFFEAVAEAAGIDLAALPEPKTAAMLKAIRGRATELSRQWVFAQDLDARLGNALTEAASLRAALAAAEQEVERLTKERAADESAWRDAHANELTARVKAESERDDAQAETAHLRAEVARLTAEWNAYRGQLSRHVPDHLCDARAIWGEWLATSDPDLADGPALADDHWRNRTRGENAVWLLGQLRGHVERLGRELVSAKVDAEIHEEIARDCESRWADVVNNAKCDRETSLVADRDRARNEAHAARQEAAQLRERAGAYCPDDIRAAGWVVAVHNDYRQGGRSYTFWLFTQGDQCVKGEGPTDADALNVIRDELGLVRAAAGLDRGGQAPDRQAIHEAFHRAWTAVVGTSGYSKATWRAAEAQLTAALTQPPAGGETGGNDE